MSDQKKAEVLQKLADARAETKAFLSQLTTAQWETAVYNGHDDDGNWHIIDVVRHLVNAEKGMTRLMMQIRDGGEGVPADFDLNRWNASGVARSKSKTVNELLTDMETIRTTLVQFIDRLHEDDWAKKGRHGSMQIMRIDEICHLIADHEISHRSEVQKAIAGLP